MNLRDFDAGPLEHVEHQVDGARSTLVFVHRSRHSPAKVWGALTEAAQLRRWAPFDPDRNLNKTGRATLRIAAASNGTIGRPSYSWPPRTM